MRRLQILVLVLFALLIVGIPTMAADQEITIDAADMEYDLEAKAVVATGNVTLRSADLEVRSEKMVYYDTGWIEAEGQAYIKTATGEYQGESLRYHIPSQTGEIKKVKGKNESLYIRGSSFQTSPSEKTMTNGVVTRCELEKPCYHLRAGRVRLVNGRVIIMWGWLYLKGVPVLPIPYLNLNADSTDSWPDIELSYSKKRGVYATVSDSFSLSPNTTAYGTLGFGTREWQYFQTGLNWNPLKNSRVNFEYTFENNYEDLYRNRLEATYSHNFAKWSLYATTFREWDDYDESFWYIAGTWPVWKKDSQSLKVQLSQEYHREHPVDSEDWYGGYKPGVRLLYSPNTHWTAGYGLLYGDDNLRGFGTEGLSHEVSLWGNQNLGKNWALNIDAAYQWNDDQNSHWDRQLVGITRKFHCYTFGFHWDGVEEEWRLSYKLDW